MVYNKSHQSSMINASTYDSSTGDLLVTFNGGSIYKFNGVTESDYDAFSNAESVGKSFNEYIRKYEGSKMITEIENDGILGEPMNDSTNDSTYDFKDNINE